MSAHSRLRISRRLLTSGLALTLVTALLPAAPAGGATSTWWVAPTGNDATGTGAKTAPFRTITEALTHAVSGDAVKVLPGIYDTAAGESFPLSISGNIDILGVGPGRPKVRGNGVDSVIFVTNPSLTEICGLEISGGGSDDVVPHWGSGIYVFSNVADDSIVIRDCWIHDNETIDNGLGGGICFNGPGNKGPQFMVLDCRIEDNVAHGSGGGIGLLWAGTIVLRGSVITGNRAISDTAEGGGVYLSRGDEIYVEDNEITFNHAGTAVGGTGGGFYFYECDGSFINNLVAGNSSTTSGTSGVLHGTGAVTIRNCTMADNFCSPPNGAAMTTLVRTVSGTASLVDSVVYSNTPAGISNSTMTYDNVISDDAFIADPEVTDIDPLFLRADTDENPDYRVERESPCVDTATTSPGYLDHDLDGRPRPIDGDDISGAVPDIGCYELYDGVVRRLSGGNRYETACDIWSKTLPEASTSSAVIATGRNFPDALSASALAGAVEGPLLLVDTNSVPQDVLDTLLFLGVNGVYVVGGESVVSNTVVTTLETNGMNVIRVAGADRYKTAAAVAGEVKYVMGSRYSNRVFVATGLNFPDALAASPWAYASGVPVLLAKTTTLPQTTADAIQAGATSGVFIVGGPDVVSPDVAQAIDSITGIGTPVRLAGADRYATARAVAAKSTGEDISPELHWHEPGLATGLNFPDALAGGAASGAWGSPLLLTRTATLPAVSGDILSANKVATYRVSIMGGPVVVTDAVMTAAAQAIQ